MNLKNHKFFLFTWIGSLTFLAGALNIAAILLFESTIAHQTGNLSKAAIALSQGQFGLFGYLTMIIGMFFLGSMISGLLFYDKTGDLKLLYAGLSAIFGSVLFLTTMFTQDGLMLLMLIALGLGVQNGMFIRVRSILIRTTHMTGYITDAAFSLGAILRGNTHELWKFSLYSASVLVFFIGGLASVWIVTIIQHKTLQVIAMLYLVLAGFVYFFYPNDD